MLSLYYVAVIALSATSVLSAPARLNEARDVESHLSRRNFYWQCPQGQNFTGNPPPSANPGACTGCQPGTFSPDGVNCYVTPKGFYNDKAGAFDPVGCLPGTYTDSTGSQVCQTCTAPLTSSAAATTCVPCADGSTSIDSRSCTRCPSGSSSIDGAACSQCQPGTFYAGIACHATPAGFYNDKPGASDPVGCLPGTYSDTTGATVCKACASPLMSYAAFAKCIPCADGSTSTDGQYCHSCPSGTSSKDGSVCSQANPYYSILVTDSSDNVQGYLSNQGEVDGSVRVQGPSEAMQINEPSSFLASDMPINLLSTTLGTKSGFDGNDSERQPGFGYSLALVQIGYDNLDCDGTSNGVLLTQSTTDNVAEYFNQANDWGGGNYAASKIWVIGAFDPLNNRYPLSFSIYGNPDSKVPPVTNAYIKRDRHGLRFTVDCDPSYNGPEELFYLVPAVN